MAASLKNTTSLVTLNHIVRKQLLDILGVFKVFKPSIDTWGCLVEENLALARNSSFVNSRIEKGPNILLGKPTGFQLLHSKAVYFYGGRNTKRQMAESVDPKVVEVSNEKKQKANHEGCFQSHVAEENPCKQPIVPPPSSETDLADINILPRKLQVEEANTSGSKETASPPEMELKHPKRNKSRKKKCTLDSYLFLDTLFDPNSIASQRVTKRLKLSAKSKTISNKPLPTAGSLEESKGDRKKEERPPTPNYFLAIKIDDTNICKEVVKFHESVIEKECLFKHVLISPKTLHLTLLVMTIKDDAGMVIAKETLQSCKDELQSIFKMSPQELVFTGINHFRNKVVFVELAGKCQVVMLDTLNKMVKLLQERCLSKGMVLSNDTKTGFIPHATVMKMSKNVQRMKKKGIRKIDNMYFNDYVQHGFGSQKFSEILLCSMLDKKDDNGFYKVEDRLCLTDVDSEVKYSRSSLLNI